jgi:hypothetical protein
MTLRVRLESSGIQRDHLFETTLRIASVGVKQPVALLIFFRSFAEHQQRMVNTLSQPETFSNILNGFERHADPTHFISIAKMDV